ncbi:MAG: O-antigen ligase family protein [Candidatus Roizmanbacteria bacterium]|nr:O-antigen ligase family protein [Candidatus Roizmanbacteria bacterium]
MSRFLKYILLITFALFSFGQLGRIHIPDQPIYFYIYELFMVATIFLMGLISKREIFKNYNFRHPANYFLIWMGCSFLISLFYYSTQENSIAILYAVRLFMYGVFFFYLRYCLKLLSIRLDRGIVYISVFIFLSSILQYFLYPNIGNIAYLGWDPHISRLVGVFLDPPIAAAVIFLAGWFVLSRFLRERKKTYAIFSILISFLLIVLTYSRGAFLALFGTMLLYGIFLKRYVAIAITVVVFGLLVFLIPKAQTESINLLRTTSISARFEDYQKGIEIWKKSPILGIGYNHIRFEKEKYIYEVFVESYNPSHGIASFHSSFMIVLVTGGVVGLILFLYILLDLAKKSTFMMIAIVFLSILSFFDNVLLHPFVIFFLGVLYLSDSMTEKSLTHPVRM